MTTPSLPVLATGSVTPSSSSTSPTTTTTATTTSTSSGALSPVAADSELVVRVSVPVLSARRTVKLLGKNTVGDVVEQLLSTYHQLDSTERYGLAVSDDVSGFVAAADDHATLAALGVKDGDTIVFGPMEVAPAVANTPNASVPVATPDPKFVNSKWGTADWNAAGSGVSGDKLLVSVEHVAAGVTKLVQWNASKRVSEALSEFCEKVDVAPATDYAFFYVPHGLPSLYEIQMASSELVGAYENNLLLSTVIFRRL